MARKRIRNKPGNQANNERRQRTLSNKEDKSDSFKRANINTISSRVTMASTVDMPTSSTTQTSSESKSYPKEPHPKEGKQHREAGRQSKDASKEAKQTKEPKQPKSACRCDLLPRSNHRVYDSDQLKKSETKLKKLNECTRCEEVRCDKGNNLAYNNKAFGVNGKVSGVISGGVIGGGVIGGGVINGTVISCNAIGTDRVGGAGKLAGKLPTNLMSGLIDKKQQPQDEPGRQPPNQSVADGEQIRSAVVIDEPIKKSRRFQTKYQFIDEDAHVELQTGGNGLNHLDDNLERLGNEFNNLSELNDRNNNKFISGDNEFGRESGKPGRPIELGKQLETNLISNLGNNLDNKLAANKLDNAANGDLANSWRGNRDATNSTDKNLPNRRHPAAAPNTMANSLHASDQAKDLPDELRQTNDLETRLNSGLNESTADGSLDGNLNNVNSTSTATDRSNKPVSKGGSSIQTIASTAAAIRIKNHSNTMAKKERKTAKVLAIITGELIESID